MANKRLFSFKVGTKYLIAILITILITLVFSYFNFRNPGILTASPAATNPGHPASGVGGTDIADRTFQDANYSFPGNVGIGTTSPGGGTGSSVLSLANSSAAPTALANTTHLYSSAGEGYWMDAAGNATLQTPHDPETGEWIFCSKNTKTGRVVRVDMERMVKAIEKVTGEQFMVETYE